MTKIQVRKPKTMTVRIDRAKWAVVKGDPAQDPETPPGGSMMLNPNGLRCCLGHCDKQMFGVSDVKAYYFGYPDDVRRQYKKLWVDNLFTEVCAIHHGASICPTRLTNEAACINDNCGLTIPEKEAALIDLFKTKGITLEFYGTGWWESEDNE